MWARGMLLQPQRRGENRERWTRWLVSDKASNSNTARYAYDSDFVLVACTR